MRKQDPFWQYAAKDGGAFICNFCNKKFQGGATRLKSHLSRIPGRDIIGCTQVSDEVQALAVVAVGKMGSSGSGTKRPLSDMLSSQSNDDAEDSSLVQTTIKGLVNKKDKDGVDMKVTLHFVENNISFNVIQTNPFKEMIEVVSNFGPGYKLPSYSTLRTKLVKKTREDVEVYIAEVKESWSSTGCTIMSNMWTDIKGRSYINVIASSPKGAVFLRSFERSADKKTGEFLKELLLLVINEIGTENVVQVVFDNASNYGLAGDLIMVDHPHITRGRCVAHGVQLLLKDMYLKISWMKIVFDKAKSIVDYMNAHGVITSVVREFTEKELKKPGKTRFASYFLMLQSVLDAEDGLRHTVASATWRNLQYSNTPAAKKVVDIIHENNFWDEGRELVKFLEPLVRILRLADGDGSTFGYIYEAMERARRTLSEWYKQNPDKYETAMELFESRRKTNILHHVHAAAAYLNPSLMYDKKVANSNPEVKEGLLFIGNKMLESDERLEFAQQLVDYDGKDPKIFHYMSIAQMKIAHPRVWWEMNGGPIPIVQKVAVRILSQPCSASCCERNWSAFDAAQTKKRNRLAPSMLEDLVYIRMNLLMLKTSQDLQMRDRKVIDLENLGPLADYEDNDEETEGNSENQENQDANVENEDSAWLDLTFGGGSISID